MSVKEKFTKEKEVESSKEEEVGDNEEEKEDEFKVLVSSEQVKVDKRKEKETV